MAGGLRQSFVPVVEAVGGPAARPGRLAQLLVLDKSLSSRLLRAIRSDDPFELIHTVPSPNGLRILLDAAASRKVDQELIKGAERSVEEFQMLLDEIPGGRSTLDAAVSSVSPQVRERNERASRQAVYKAMSNLMGYQCDSLTSTLIMWPATDKQFVDCAQISAKCGLQAPLVQ